MGAMERVRWGNVLRALAVVAVLGLVVAWPLLAQVETRVPSGREVPMATRAPTASPRPAPRRPARPVVRRERRAGERGGGARRGRDPGAPRTSKPPTVSAAPAPRAAPAVTPAPVAARPAPSEPQPVPARPVPSQPQPVAARPAPAMTPAPAPPDPDPVLREFGPEGP